MAAILIRSNFKINFSLSLKRLDIERNTHNFWITSTVIDHSITFLNICKIFRLGICMCHFYAILGSLVYNYFGGKLIQPLSIYLHSLKIRSFISYSLRFRRFRSRNYLCPQVHVDQPVTSV